MSRGAVLAPPATDRTICLGQLIKAVVWLEGEGEVGGQVVLFQDCHCRLMSPIPDVCVCVCVCVCVSLSSDKSDCRRVCVCVSVWVCVTVV